MCDASLPMQCLACGQENGEGITACEGCGAPLDRVTAERMLGTTVGGRFRITRVLGEGGMGVVYEAEQVLGNTVRKVAVKMLHPHLSNDRSITARFHRECGTIAQLEHPNTIRVFDFGQTDEGALYIAMEYVRGRPLAEIIEAGPMQPERVARVMSQICAALTEAHSLGVVHRDLKPDNILLSDRAGEEDFVKVLDFGIAHTQATSPGEQKLTKQGMVLGTPPYMSPEQFSGQKLDARSDVYSLGVMAYEMLTGRLPFDANTPWEWASKHLTEPPASFDASTVGSHAPAAMKQAIMRALAKDRDGRPPSTKQFAAELSGATDGVVSSAAVASAPGFRTEAMPGAPEPGMAAPRLSPVEPASGGGSDPLGTPAPGGTQAAAIPPAPYTPPSGRPRTAPGVAASTPSAPQPARKKGLVYGLAAAGGVLAVLIVIVAAQGAGSGAGDPPPPEFVVATQPNGEGTPAAELLAMGDGDAESEVVAVAVEVTPEPAKRPKERPETKPPEAKPPETKPPETKPPETKPPETKPPREDPKSPGLPGGIIIPDIPFPPIKLPTTMPPPTTTEPKPSGDPCDKCLAAVRSGDFVGAGTSYGRCTKREGRRRCRSAARTEAPRRAKRAADAGRCTEARAIEIAASAMGADSKVLRRISQKCK